MEDVEVQEDDILCQFNFEELPEDLGLFGDDFFISTESCVGNSLQESSNPSRDSSPSWICELEQMLMKEDKVEEENQAFCDDFFCDILPIAPVERSDEAGALNDEDSNQDSNVSDDAQEKEKSDLPEIKKGEDEDPISKKRKRQIRNRDAALRSRERKKLYVRDLELKSRYLEGECIRLQRLLQCCAAENHALHLQLQKEKAFGASMTKQESAVLLLESLLLGSLLWFLGIMCLFPLPKLLHSILPANKLVDVGRNSLEVVDPVALGGARNERRGLGTLRLFFKRKRCKGTMSRMKTMPFSHAVTMSRMKTMLFSHAVCV